MAAALFTSRSPKPPTPQEVVPPMPHVFVVPPEEDDSPAWCCFDAANPALSQVIEQPETPESPTFSFHPDMDTPVFRRNSRDPVIMPQRSIETRSVVEALMSDDFEGDADFDSDSEYEQLEESEDDPHSIQESPRSRPSRRLHDAANDSDVIEVIKVRRNRSPPQEAEDDRQILPPEPGNAQPNTLKSRASKVFKSLRGTLRSKSRIQAQDIFASGSSRSIAQDRTEISEQPETLPRPRSPGVSRRGSRILSQLFTAPPLKTRTSVAPFDEPPPASPISPTLLPSNSSSSMHGNFIASASSQEPLIRRSSLYEPSEQDQIRLQAASPTPTATTKSGTRRFSIMSLQKIFSFTSPKPPPAAAEPIDPPSTSDDSDRATPTLRSTPSSLISGSVPQTPTSTDDIIPPVRLVKRDETAPTDVPVFDSLDSMFDTNGGLNLGLGLGLSLDSGPGSTVVSEQDVEKTPRKPSSSWTSSMARLPSKLRANSFSPPPRVLEPENEDEDESLELRLDSFHFDNLSFDADQFKVT
ncbi:hypothetical protein NLJ89_g7712 [Agrocybe chaxingu]|uniref:Uncharacterized protein n=1 Tax=Agrocybe chaxingu TaxID=84603 RepID=A0A9W8JYP3_9AGAR|nr:hypothetical protein NLJ89_g7712 [Agrocybe chaxingu]